MFDLDHYTATVTTVSFGALACGFLTIFFCHKAWVQWPAYLNRVALFGATAQLLILMVAVALVYSAYDQFQGSMENFFHGEAVKLDKLANACQYAIYTKHLPSSLECAEYHFQATRQILAQTKPLPISSSLRDAMVVLFAAFNGGLAAGMLLLGFSSTTSYRILSKQLSAPATAKKNQL